MIIKFNNNKNRKNLGKKNTIVLVNNNNRENMRNKMKRVKTYTLKNKAVMNNVIHVNIKILSI